MRYTKVAPEIYDDIKRMLADGYTQTECGRLTRLSPNTINKIVKSKTLDEYRQMVRAEYANRKCPVPDKQTDDSTELLRQILEKLTIIVDRLT